MSHIIATNGAPVNQNERGSVHVEDLSVTRQRGDGTPGLGTCANSCTWWKPPSCSVRDLLCPAGTPPRRLAELEACSTSRSASPGRPVADARRSGAHAHPIGDRSQQGPRKRRQNSRNHPCAFFFAQVVSAGEESSHYFMALGRSLRKTETILPLRQARGSCGLSGPFVDQCTGTRARPRQLRSSQSSPSSL